MVVGAGELSGYAGIQKPLAALRSVYLLDFRHKKRRPWTSFFDHLVGRGNLNRFFKMMILKYYFRLNILLEYLLEYHPRIFLNSCLYVDQSSIPQLYFGFRF